MWLQYFSCSFNALDFWQSLGHLYSVCCRICGEIHKIEILAEDKVPQIVVQQTRVKQQRVDNSDSLEKPQWCLRQQKADM